MARVFLRCGHYGHDKAFDGAPLECPWGCGRQERDEEPIMENALITGDPVVEHWNNSLNAPVRSRRHLKDLQRAHGVRDYVPSPEMKDRTDRAMGRLKAKHGR